MPARPNASRPAPFDQAQGLRRMFGGERLRFVPLVHNPHVPGGGVVMERLCAALSDQGLATLVVDAADSASLPDELSSVDLSACVERLTHRVSYLAARGLPKRYLDNRATMVGFLDALRSAMPSADVVLLHAGAQDLRRMFAGRTPRPILLAGNRPDSLTHAYASMKLLHQRLGALAYDLVIAADVAPRRARRMAERLGECADHFLGSALHHCAVVDPLEPAGNALPLDLRRLMTAQVASPGATTTAAPLPAGHALAAAPVAGPAAAPLAMRNFAAGRVN